MQVIEDTLQKLKVQPKRWLITGVAGFIGSHLLEALLKEDQYVVGIDNLSTGFKNNLSQVKQAVSNKQWERFIFYEGDIRDAEICARVTTGVDYVLHQAALGSVPRSLQNPIITNETNVSGFLNMLVASRDAGVERFVYAASSSTYGDHPVLPKVENNIGKPLSPYAVTKYVNELYAEVFGRCYGLKSVGLRYFNVFGPRQDPNGLYSAVIPKWYSALIRGEKIFINGDGETSRDFCFVSNVVQANILAATTDKSEAWNQVYNVALGDRTTLNELYYLIKERVGTKHKNLADLEIEYRPFRDGDVRHSQADISKIKEYLGFYPRYNVAAGLDEATEYYISTCS